MQHGEIGMERMSMMRTGMDGHFPPPQSRPLYVCEGGLFEMIGTCSDTCWELLPAQRAITVGRDMMSGALVAVLPEAMVHSPNGNSYPGYRLADGTGDRRLNLAPGLSDTAILLRVLRTLQFINNGDIELMGTQPMWTFTPFTLREDTRERVTLPLSLNENKALSELTMQGMVGFEFGVLKLFERSCRRMN